MSDWPPAGFRLGSHEFAFSVLDCQDHYESGSVDAQYVGQLELDPRISVAAAHFGALVRTFPGDLTIFDGHRLVISALPELVRDPGDTRRRILRLRFMRTSYFAGALFRSLPTPEFNRHVISNWPSGALSIRELRELVRGPGTFHPLANPGTGVSICPVVSDDYDDLWTVLHRRARSVAVNPGMWCTAIDEGFSEADISSDGRLDPWATARRGAKEELGIDLSDVTLFGFGLDPVGPPGGPQSTGSGYVFSGWARADVSLAELRIAGSRSDDAFEAEQSLIVRLTPDGVVAALSGINPGRITGPALYGLLGTLDRVQPGAAARARKSLPELWQRWI
jgi:hypothetical protein